MKIHKLIYIPALVLGLSTAGCGKFLNEKSDKGLDIPDSLEDYQALLNSDGINTTSAASGEMSADNYFLTTANYNSLNFDYARNTYKWAGLEIEGGGNRDWELGYSRIYTSTFVLEGIEKIPRNNENKVQWDNLKGQALALRAYRYLDAAVIWSKAYDAATADEDLGIPLRQTTDFNQLSVRASVQQTYDEIIRGLKEAIPLLPTTKMGITRVSKQMAYSTLSRTYLFMRKYEEARLYADSALQISDKLLDFNGLTDISLPAVSFGELNEEIVFFMSVNVIGQLLERNKHCVDTLLYDTFSDNDLRKSVFFRENIDRSFYFQGNHTGNIGVLFSGITNAELYLTRAECYARGGQVAAAMDDLNMVLKHRIDETFIPLTASTKEQALEIILLERRKELMFRGTRWPDIKRLNKEGANIVLTRVIDGKTYTLPPNDNRYALPIPEDVIQMSGMPQNPQ